MPKKLLLADDSVTIQRVIELTFAEEDIQVVAVGDGQQAIARIDAERPDVVLADIGMPERDGYEVAAHVKGNPQTAQIPVLLLTGAFEPIDEARARAVGCDGVLVKPFEPQMVINRVKDLLAGRRPASLWSVPPVPSGATVVPGHAAPAPKLESAEAAKAKAGSTPAARSEGAPGDPRALESLDDYFDRLDAAFANGAGPAPAPGFDARPAPAPPPPQPAAAADPSHEYGTWDIPTEPIRSIAPPPSTPPRAPVPSRPPEPGPQQAPVANEVPAIAPEMSPVAQAPALADAFAALLAAEQKMGVPGPPREPAAAAPPALDDARIEEIVRRVLARMSEDMVRSTVLDVAERLVRDEIDKIKRQAKI